MANKKRGGRRKGSKASEGQTVNEGAGGEMTSSTVPSTPEVGGQEPSVPPTPPSGTGASEAKPEDFPAFGQSGGSFESAWGKGSPWKGARPKDKNQKSSGSSGTTEEKRMGPKEVPTRGQGPMKDLSVEDGRGGKRGSGDQYVEGGTSPGTVPSRQEMGKRRDVPKGPTPQTRPSGGRAIGPEPKKLPSGQGGGSGGSVWGKGSPWQGARPKERQESSGSPGQTRVETRGGITPKAVPTPQGQVKELSLTQVGEHLKDKLGTLGRKIQIETNHMRVDLGSLTQVYRYDVSVQPEKKPKKMVRVAMELFRKSYFPQNHPSYDGQKLLYSAKPLPLPGDVVTGKVTIQTDRGEEQEFTITIKLTGTVDLSPLRHLLQKKNVGEDEAFQCVEVVFKQAYTSSFINVGRRFYFKSLQNEYLLGTGAQMYLGGYQAMSKGWVPFLNVDVAHKAFTVAIPLTELVVQMCNTRNRPVTLDNLKTFSLASYHFEELNQYLKGFKVVYQIPNHPGSKKVYRINGLEERPSWMRFLQENQWVTVEEYFQTKWRCVLRYPNLPTLWVGNVKKNIYLPLEYCVLQEGQPIDSSKMVKTQTSAMSNHSATSTTERKNKIQKIMQRAEHNQNPCVKEFGFSVGNGFQQVEGRVLDAPRLRYSEGTVEPSNGSWWAKKFLNGATIRKWRVVGVEIAHSLNSKIGDLIRMLISLGKTSGMTFSPPEATIFISNQKAALERCFQQNKSLQLLLVVLPNNKDSYFWVKQSAELTVGCLTQCVKCDTLFKLSETTVRNILLKINTKSNGLNHVVHDLKLVTDETCMVMGADVTHPSPQATAIPSVVAVTASEDLTATKYNISVDLQVPRQTMSEMIQNLESITVDKLRTFIARNNTPPARIYFFRDGVSEGEFDRVRDVEIKAILRACATVCKNRLPKLTFLVVQKRHHTRFFPTGRESTGEEKFRNVPVGTCVDRVITDPTLQNFYLQSHSSFKGVARPTKYWTLYDENQLTNDDVQALTFHLCHVFTRCNKSVSYPAPTYFAHLAADRAKGYLYKQEIRMEELNLDLVKIQEDFARANPMFFS